MNLVRGALWALDRERLIIVCENERIIAEAFIPAQDLSVGPPFGFSDLLDLASEANRDELVDVLRQRRLLTEYTSDPEPGTPNAMPLRDALCQAKRGILVGPTRVCTANEVLYLGDNPSLNRTALRLFVSRFADVERRVIYGALTVRSNLLVGGDLPPHQVLTRLPPLESDDGARVCVFDLRNGGFTANISGSGDFSTGNRLSVTAITESRAFVARATSIHTLVGVSALPNLALVADLPLDNRLPGVLGCDVDENVARTKCLAEGVERFASGDVPMSRLIFESAEFLAEWLHPGSILKYSKEQVERLGLSEFDTTRSEYWVQGENGRGRIWVPAALAYYPFAPLPNWLTPGAVSSSGVAAGLSFAEAKLRAWLELVERDAFVRALAVGPHQVPTLLTTQSDTRSELVDLLEILSERSAVNLLRIESPTGIPVVLARCDNDDGIAFGMSANASETDAAWKACTEALAQVDRPYGHDVELQAVAEPGDHAALYRRPEYRRLLDWMLDGPRRPLQADVCEVRYHENAIAIDLSTRLAPTTSVVRVLDPQLIPLTFGYDSEPLGRPDLSEAWRRRGYDFGRPLIPHPFA